MRVQRDIPAGLIVDGVKKSNLRQLAQQRLHKQVNVVDVFGAEKLDTGSWLKALNLTLLK